MKEQEQYKIFKRKSQWLCYAVPPLTSQMAIYTKHKTKAEALKQLEKETGMTFKFKSAKQVFATIYKANGKFESQSITAMDEAQ
jgi:hypothetical protein